MDINKDFKKKKIDEDLNIDVNIDNDLVSYVNAISKIDSNINDLYENLNRWFRNDTKGNKIIEILDEKIRKKDNDIYMKEKELDKEKNKNIDIYKRIIDILDQVESINEYANATEDKNLKIILDNVNKNINRYLSSIDIEEINPIMQIYDSKLHECLKIEDIDKFKNNPMVTENTIVKVIKKGYKLHGSIFKSAKVIVVKNKKIMQK
ncbi:nucleotide exchange factor GrpE [Peptacetobacter sp.]|uniref:nucleotide exchange factor GrpE n=1 Tax=Peptacetobacter sp. TaxID=2991975 RepID=UPI00262BF91E|nr:nucleotide exchange factor GrpE [Peptacetobacter sp.]